jgi:predicted phage gp36 major capsid-like protein
VERPVDAAKQEMRRLWEEACKKTGEADEAEKKAVADEKAAAEPVRVKANKAIQDAVSAQEKYCAELRRTAFAHELLGMIYAGMGNNHEASGHYKLALLARQTSGQPDKQPGIESASPLLMDAYRNACAAVKGMY